MRRAHVQFGALMRFRTVNDNNKPNVKQADNLEYKSNVRIKWIDTAGACRIPRTK